MQIKKRFTSFFWPKWPEESSWLALRPVGNLIFLKVSYLALILIPILVKNNFIATYLLQASKFDLITIYLSSLSLAFANILYDVYCPAVIKRFESPNDLYLKMLEIKKLSDEFYKDDNFDASLSHCKEKFKTDKKQLPQIGKLTHLLFTISLILYGMIFIKRTFEVLFILPSA